MANVTDGTGAVVNRYDYSPYGVTTETALTGALDNPWRYTGQFQDEATGLYKIGYRYLDPGLGRWTQPDPGLKAYETQFGNRYLYVGCNPVNHVDPTGLGAICDAAALFMGLVGVGLMAAGVLAGIFTVLTGGIFGAITVVLVSGLMIVCRQRYN